MAQRHVTVKDTRPGPSVERSLVGESFIYRTSVWKVQGLYLTSSSSGDRDVWWILGRQNRNEDDVEGEA